MSGFEFITVFAALLLIALCEREETEQQRCEQSHSDDELTQD